MKGKTVRSGRSANVIVAAAKIVTHYSPVLVLQEQFLAYHPLNIRPQPSQ